MGLRKTFLAIGVAILLALFICYGVYVFYEPPKDSYPGQDCYYKYNCDELFNCTGKYLDQYPDKPVKIPISEQDTCFQEQYSSKEYIDCQLQIEKCREEAMVLSPLYTHAKYSFYALLILGAIALIIGAFLKHLEGIGSGFIGGGILIILWTLPYTNAYWFNWNKYVKLIALGLVLVLLVYLGYKKLEK